MAFDPSIISQIPDSAPNPVRQKETAFRLADLIDQEQLSRLKLNAAKSGQQDTEKAKSILKDADYSTPQGVTKTAEKLSRAGLPDQAMDFMKVMQQLQQGKGELQKQQYEMMAARNDIVGNAAAGLVGEYDSLAARVGSTQAAAMMQPKYQAAIQQLSGMKLPDGSSALGPEQLQQIQGNPQFNPDFIRTVAQRSKEGAAALKAQLEFHKEQTSEARLDETERHNREMESQGRLRVGGGGTPDEQSKISSVYAAMADKGISFPPGMRSVAAQRQTIQGLLKSHPSDSADQVAERVRSGEISFATSKREADVVARREGSAAAAINALNREGGLYDQLMETGQKVDFGSAKFQNAFKLWKAGAAIADPDISEYVNALADTRAEFASVLARGGQVTDSVRIAAEHAFPDKMSFAELQRNVERSKKIATSIQQGNTAVIDAIVNGKSMEEAMKAKPSESAVKPYDDADKEARYQAWKKAHGG